MTTLKHKIIYSTDADLFQSDFIVTDANPEKYCNAFYIVPVCEEEKFQVYNVDLFNSLNDWFDIKEIEEFTGIKYSEIPEKDRDGHFWINLTRDVASYYSPLNFGAPTLVEADNLENYITS